VVRYTIERDGFIDTFENWCVFANACGPCIGMWDREGLIKKSATLSFTLLIVTFLNVLMEIKHIGFRSPELVTAMAIAGDLVSTL
jgi:aconitate hydratase